MEVKYRDVVMAVNAECLTASSDADGLFELMTAEVITQLDNMRAHRLTVAVIAGWRGRVEHKRAHKERLALSVDTANWSCKQLHFFALVVHQQRMAAHRTTKAIEFWRLGLLHAVFSAWGPLLKLHYAECVGEADRCIRRCVLHSRLSCAFGR